MRTVKASGVRAALAALLDALEGGGEPIVITRRSKPVARLSPVAAREGAMPCP